MKTIYLMLLAIALQVNVFGQDNCNFDKLTSKLDFYKKATWLKYFEIALDQKTKESTKIMILSAGVKYGFEVVFDTKNGGDISFGFQRAIKGFNLKEGVELYNEECYFPELSKMNGNAYFEYECDETGAYKFEVNLQKGVSACCVVGIYFLGQSSKALATRYSEDSVYTKVDVMAEYPGGFSGMSYDIRAELKRNKIASKQGSSVIIDIIVSGNGKVNSLKFVESPGKRIEEIIRKVIYAKNWTPAYVQGKPVKQALNLRLSLK